MATVKRPILVFFLLFVLHGVYASTHDGDVTKLFDALVERIKSLEARDEANNAKIMAMEKEFKMKQANYDQRIFSLEMKINGMESNFKLKEAKMLEQINELRVMLIKSTEDTPDDQVQQEEHAGQEQQSVESNKKQKRSISRKDREGPDTEVAFYATHSEHDIHHLGSNQILTFQQAFTNIGNAYNNNTGAFVAPVDGTYIFHATVMGIDTHSDNHLGVHFDVNGTVYARLYVTPYDQSSQMLVINLKTGQTVTLRNSQPDEGFVGQHYSTFSGFLLYQRFPSVEIVGK